jgi:hypothetical protein
LYDGAGETTVNADPSSDQPDKAAGWAGRAFLWVAFALAVVYLPMFFGRIVFFRDIAHWIFPVRVFVRDCLLRGELPAWNPLQGLGFATFSNPLYGVFYPPNWLFLLVGRDWVGAMITWQDFAHLLWGSAGVFWLARRFRATSVSAIIAALAWALSGYLTSQWTAGLRLHAAAWIPWTAVGQLALLDSLRAGGRRWRLGVVKAALPTTFALLMGELFLAMMGVGFALALLASAQIFERRADCVLPRFSRRWAAAIALALLLASGAGAVVLLPARAHMSTSDRAAPLSRTEAEVHSLHPLRFIEFAAPGSMGDAYGEYPAGRWVGEASADGLPLSYSVYMGASVLALALAAFRRKRPVVFVLAGLSGFALLLALGKHLPVHAVFRRVVFPLGRARAGAAGRPRQPAHSVWTESTLAPDRDPARADGCLRDRVAFHLSVPLVGVHGTRAAPRGRGCARCARGSGAGGARFAPGARAARADRGAGSGSGLLALARLRAARPGN